MPQTAKQKACAPPATFPPAVASGLRPLAESDRDEVLDFLAAGSVDSIFMSGLVYDNGVSSPLNRGAFCAYRGEDGALEGVALVGHATLVETRTERALEAFADFAKRCRTAHMIVGDEEKVERFWRLYRDGGQEARRVCRELFFVQRRAPDGEDVPGLRLATFGDLPHVMRVNALMAEEESGVNPLAADAEGFRRRTLRRVEQGRVWVWVEAGRLMFKADVMAETPEFTYLEGVWVNPEDRRRGLGRRCLAQLGRTLLARTRVLCLLVNEQNKDAQAFFISAGYKLRGCYDTVFLKKF